MKYELKDLEKAIEYAKKNGAICVEIETDPRTHKLMISYQGTDIDKVSIQIAVYESGLWNDIITTKRF